jgi:hypothetical protein
MIIMPVYEARAGLTTTAANVMACRKVNGEMVDVEMSKHGAVGGTPADTSTKPEKTVEV